jgi:hypothetical protein
MPVKIPAETKVFLIKSSNKIINKQRKTDCQQYETSASETKFSHLSYRHLKSARMASKGCMQ